MKLKAANRSPNAVSLESGKRRPFWSVMIPTYKMRWAFLKEALSSVLLQDPGSTEMQIAVVDDASPNGAPIEMIREVAGDRVCVYQEPINLGLAGIWNRCVELSQGEWIHILHQDDFVLPSFYSKMRTLVGGNPGSGAAFSRHAFVQGDGHWQAISELHQSSPGPLHDQVRKVFSLQVIHCPAIVVAAQTYRELGGFDARFTHALDWEMWMRIAAQRLILFEPTLLAAYRIHLESTTARQTEKAENFVDIERVIRHSSVYLPLAERGPIVRRALSYYADVALAEGWKNIWRRKFEVAAAQLTAAHSLAPSLTRKIRIDFARLRLLEQRLRFKRNRV